MTAPRAYYRRQSYNVASHVFFSQTWLFLSILMGAGMAVIMHSFMMGTMFKDVKANIAVVVCKLIAFSTALF